MSQVPVTGLISARGLNAPQRSLTIEEATECWHQLWALHDTTPWVIGDYYNWLTDTYGEQASQMFGAESVEDRRRMHTAQTYGSVCRKYDRSSRLEFQSLSFSHFEVVAAVPDAAKRQELLARAAKDDVNVKDLRSLAAPLKPERKKGPKVINVAGPAQDDDEDRPVMDRGRFAAPERDQPAPSTRAALKQTFTDLIIKILDLPDNPVLSRDLEWEGFDRLDDLDRAIFKLSTVRGALVRKPSAPASNSASAQGRRPTGPELADQAGEAGIRVLASPAAPSEELPASYDNPPKMPPHLRRG